MSVQKDIQLWNYLVLYRFSQSFRHFPLKLSHFQSLRERAYRKYDKSVNGAMCTHNAVRGYTSHRYEIKFIVRNTYLGSKISVTSTICVVAMFLMLNPFRNNGTALNIIRLVKMFISYFYASNPKQRSGSFDTATFMNEIQKINCFCFPTKIKKIREKAKKTIIANERRTKLCVFLERSSTARTHAIQSQNFKEKS